MRVCLALPYSWAYPAGVPEHVVSLAGHLERRGHEVSVVSPDDPLDLITRITHPGLGRHDPPPERMIVVARSLPVPSNGTIVNIAISPLAYRAAYRAVERLRPDVVHVHEPLVPFLPWGAIRAAKALGVPVVGTFHAHYPDGCVHYRIFKPALLPFHRALDARIAVSPAAARTVTEALPGEVRIIPNAVDVARFAPDGERERAPHEVLFVGRPAPRKGLPVLLEAFERLLRKVPEARLVIVGSRPEDVRLPKVLLSSVEVRGVVDETGLVEAMRSASVLCAPSVGSESFGMILIEAMAAGLPVLASDIPGYDAVVSHERDGLLFPAGDPGALAASLARLLRDSALRGRLAAAGSETVRRYDWRRVAAEIEEVYLSVLDRSRPAAGGELAAGV
ncbi:MAG: glycosyltransferase family 4 protein [Actinomycetota bacterium]